MKQEGIPFLLDITALNTVISPNFLVWKILWKRTVSAEFPAIRPKLCGKCAFPQNFHKENKVNLRYFMQSIILNHNFASDIFIFVERLQDVLLVTFGPKYSRIEQVKFVEDSH